MKRMMIAGWLCAAALSLSACGSPGGVASPGSTPGAGSSGPEQGGGYQPNLPATADAAAAVADATLPPPSSISPTAATTIDDAAIAVAWDALDTAAYAADALLVAKPSIAGTPNARKLADALEGSQKWLKIASQAQRASQADTYRAALAQASAAIAGARAALSSLKGS